MTTGYFIRHRNRRLQVTQIRSQGDKNDASFMMTDAYTGGATSVITETEQVRKTTDTFIFVF